MEDRERRMRTAEKHAVSQRNYRRARDRALTKLGQKYQEEYLTLLQKEKEIDDKEGARWDSLAGRSRPIRSRGKRTRKPTRTRRRRWGRG